MYLNENDNHLKIQDTQYINHTLSYMIAWNESCQRFRIYDFRMCSVAKIITSAVLTVQRVDNKPNE